MFRRLRRFGVVSALTIAMVALAGGAAHAASSAPKKGGTITWGVITDLASFDVAGTGPASTTNYPQVTGVYSRLVEIDGHTGKVIPRLAQSVTSNKDQTIWTIKLRPGLKFTDGTTLDAAAIKASWDRLALPATASTIRSTLATFTSWVVQDPLTFVVTLPRAQGSFVALLARSALSTIPSPTAVAKYGVAFGSSVATTVGAGPLKLSEWNRGSSMTLVKNPDYFEKGVPNVDSIVFRYIPDSATQVDAMLSKTIDIGYGVSIDQNTKKLVDGGYQYTNSLDSLGAGAKFNTSVAPFDDLRVRQAFTLATDPVDANNKANSGYAEVAGGKGTAYYPKKNLFYDKTVSMKENDLPAAQKLIDAYVAEKGPIHTTVYVPNSLKLLGDALVQQWSRLKNVTLDESVQSNAFVVGLLGKFSIEVLGVPVFDYPDQAYQQLYTGVAGNVTKYSNPQMDKLINEGYGATDIATRKKILNQIGQIVINDALEIRVYFFPWHMFVQKGIKGWNTTVDFVGWPDIRTLSRA